jgi:hypothetical protein
MSGRKNLSTAGRLLKDQQLLRYALEDMHGYLRIQVPNHCESIP